MNRSSTAMAVSPTEGGPQPAERGAVAIRRPFRIPNSEFRTGFTLIELLVVMGIAAVLAGITVASYVGITQRQSRQGAQDNVMDVLRQARVSAVDTGRGSVVRIEPSTTTTPATIYGIASQVIGAWHFEESTGTTTPGAQGNDGTFPAGVPTSAAGKLGLAFRFDGSTTYVDCGNLPKWNQTTGIRLEAWVKPGTGVAASSAHIVSKTNGSDRGYFIGLDYIGDDTVKFEGGFGFGSGTGAFVMDPDGVAAGQWHSVAAEFDGFEARLFVDGVRVARNNYDGGGLNGAPFPNVTWTPPQLMAPDRADPLQIGRGHTDPVNPGTYGYFSGIIDEPRVLSIAGGTPVTLPQRVALLTNADNVHFDSQGFLDPAYHSSDVWVALGDPYQTMPLSGSTPATPGDAQVVLARKSPFPPAGGQVMIGSYVVHYTGVGSTNTNGDTLTGATWSLASATPPYSSTYVGSGPPADQVYFARLVQVQRSGLVTRP